MDKVYYLADCQKIIGIATEMGLKQWKLETLSGDEMQRYAITVKYPEALQKMFKYLGSEIIPDGKYKLIGKVGLKSPHRTELIIQKGNSSETAKGLTLYGNGEFSEVLKENAVLKSENYFLQEQVKVLQEQILVMQEEQEDDDDETETEKAIAPYGELIKEYAPQVMNFFTNYFAPKAAAAPIASFADAPAAPSQPIIRFSPEYISYWQNCKDQNAVNKEYEYLAANKPDKVELFTNIFANG